MIIAAIIVGSIFTYILGMAATAYLVAEVMSMTVSDDSGIPIWSGIFWPVTLTWLLGLCLARKAQGFIVGRKVKLPRAEVR